MILTYKIKHNIDYSHQLNLAKKVAIKCVNDKSIKSSKDVSHIGLKSMISCQIIRKYGRNKKIKSVKNIKLIIPNQGIKVDKDNREIYIPCLCKLKINYQFPNNFEKINQIEVGNQFYYVSVTINESKEIIPETYIGIDRNTMKHIAVCSNINTGKVLKLGKSCSHIHNKYKHIRKKLQKKGKYGLIKKIKNRESRIIKDINHKISKKVIDEAVSNKSGIVLEDLKGIRNSMRKKSKNIRYSLNSWSFYQLEMFIKYKAKKKGIPIYYIEPAYTSQTCSRCGHIDKQNRKGKLFNCNKCGTVDNADVNAGFNIARKHLNSINQSLTDRDVNEGNTDIPKTAIFSNIEISGKTVEPQMIYR